MSYLYISFSSRSLRRRSNNPPLRRARHHIFELERSDDVECRMTDSFGAAFTLRVIDFAINNVHVHENDGTEVGHAQFS